MTALSRIKKFFLDDPALCGALAVALLVKLIIVCAPLDTLIANFIPDDGFYYFEIARNITDGLGSTFDGINFTNGYHPLWMILLLPLFALFSSGSVHDVLPIRFALSLSALLDIGTGLLLYRIASRYIKNEKGRFIVPLLWWVNPFVVWETMNGLETSLSLFLLSLITCFWLEWKDNLTNRKSYYIGALFGLLALARLDMAVFALAFGVYIVSTRSWKEVVRIGVRSSLACIVVVSPWFIWNYAQSGMFFTSASETATVVNHTLVRQDNGEGIWVVVRSIGYHTLYYARQVLASLGAPLAVFLALGIFLKDVLQQGFLKRALERIKRKEVSAEWYILGAGVVLFILNASVRWVGRNWYFAYWNIPATLLCAWVLVKLWSDGSKRARYASCVFALFIAVSFIVNAEESLFERERAQRQMYEATSWMNEHLPDRSVIGVFNAGVQAYFSRHSVVNLDGLVNNAASLALQEKRLWSYVRGNVEYVSDFDLYMNYRYKSFMGVPDPFEYLETVHIVDHGIGVRGGGIRISVVR